MNTLLERLRGARRIEFFAALALAALLALVLLRGTTSSPAGNAEKTPLEARLERILSQIDGAGKVSAMVSEDGDGAAVGAVIVADELEDVRTYLSLQSAACALLELEPSRVEIIGRTGRFGGSQ